MPPLKKTPKKASAAASTAPRRVKKRTLPTDRDIAARAYQLFVQRGGEHGRDLDDWLLARRELLPPDAEA